METNSASLNSSSSSGAATYDMLKGETPIPGQKSGYCIAHSSLFNEDAWKKHDGERHHSRHLGTKSRRNKRRIELMAIPRM